GGKAADRSGMGTWHTSRPHQTLFVKAFVQCKIDECFQALGHYPAQNSADQQLIAQQFIPHVHPNSPSFSYCNCSGTHIFLPNLRPYGNAPAKYPSPSHLLTSFLQAAQLICCRYRKSDGRRRRNRRKRPHMAENSVLL